MGRKSKRQVYRENAIRDEVQEFLKMFSALKMSFDALPDNSGINEALIRFDGFDANDKLEDKYLQAARTIIGDDAYDSHMPWLRHY